MVKTLLVKANVQKKTLMSTKGKYSETKLKNNTRSSLQISAVFDTLFPGSLMNSFFHASAGNPTMQCECNLVTMNISALQLRSHRNS